MASVRGEDLAVSHKLREVASSNKQDMAAVARLHMQLLDYGPMAGLGELFIRQVGYSIHLQDGLLNVALYEVAGRPAGFVAYTSRSITFHRSGLGQHWLYVMWILTVSMLQDPRRLRSLLRAIRVILSRRAEHKLGQDPLGEIVAIAVRAEYQKSEFVRRTGLRVGQELVAHARLRLKEIGVNKIRMLVDADNKAALFFYHNLGARQERYQQAGEPMVQVWFDLEEFLPTKRPMVAQSGDDTAERSRSTSRWEAHYDELARDDSCMLFAMEAGDYFRGLKAAIPLEHTSTVLDFGCGFGLVGELLAPEVAQLRLWDISTEMRDVTRKRLARFPNCAIVGLSDPDRYNGVNFDFILINSVVQYMTADEFSAWLPRWRRMLKPQGHVVVSDIVPPNPPFLSELQDTLLFAVRHRFLLSSIRKMFVEFRRYWKIRRSQSLLRMSLVYLRNEAVKAGFAVEFLPSNLTYRKARHTAIFSTPTRDGMNCPSRKKELPRGHRDSAATAG